MKFDKTGIILYTLKYKECVNFYENILQLPKLFETEELTCFEFGKSYLMVEIDDEYTGIINERIRTCLRFNVENIKEITDKLKAKNIDVNYQEFEWGKIAKFYKESTLLNQEYIKDSKMNVLQYLQSIDKGLTATAFKRYALS